MDDRSTLELYLLGFVLLLAAVIGWSWRRSQVTAGLPLCYLLALAMIHVPGAGVFALPWNELTGLDLVVTGFRECFFALVAFILGLMTQDLVIRGKRSRALLEHSETLVRNPRMYRLPRLYLLLGVVFVGFLIPILHAIPSVSAVANSGACLMVVGVCLGCWRAWRQGQTGSLLVWLALTAGFPLFTMLTMGFIGFGIASTMVVLIFVGAHYQPRWHSILLFFLLFYLGLSVFVTYMRDRVDFRQVVWGGAGYSARVKELWSMAKDFEFLDLHNDQHLEAIDGRLNQNTLVGMAISNLKGGSVSFAQGKTIEDAFLAMIPRIIWPDKPMRAGSGDIVSRYTGLEVAEGTSVGVGQVLEFYINFGRWGVLGGFFCLGWLIRWLDWHAGNCLHSGDWVGFMKWFLPGMSILSPGGSLVEITVTLVSSFVLVLMLNVFLKEFSAGNTAPLRVSKRHRKLRRTWRESEVEG